MNPIIKTVTEAIAARFMALNDAEHEECAKAAVLATVKAIRNPTDVQLMALSQAEGPRMKPLDGEDIYRLMVAALIAEIEHSP